MLNHYCISCGSPNPYALTVPRFCCQCGQSLGGQTAVASASSPVYVPQAQPTSPKRIQRPTDDDEDEPFSLNIPDKLDIEFEVAPPYRETFGNVIGTNLGREPQQQKIKLTKKDMAGRLESFRTSIAKVNRREIGGTTE